MDDFLSQLNRLLLSTYRDIERIEERMTRDKSNAELSINELHLIETIAQKHHLYRPGAFPFAANGDSRDQQAGEKGICGEIPR